MFFFVRLPSAGQRRREKWKKACSLHTSLRIVVQAEEEHLPPSHASRGNVFPQRIADQQMDGYCSPGMHSHRARRAATTIVA
jgi:hypothetical protein